MERLFSNVSKTGDAEKIDVEKNRSDNRDMSIDDELICVTYKVMHITIVHLDIRCLHQIPTFRKHFL